MTATDELRRMLDERGVEYVVDEEYGEKYPPEQRVTWSCDLAGEDMTVTARDYCININDDGSADYCLDLEFHEVFTPEQAIEATLGRGTCHAIVSDNLTESEGTGDAWANCSECGHLSRTRRYLSRKPQLREAGGGRCLGGVRRMPTQR